MAVPTWKMVLTDLAGTQIGDVQNASSMQVVLPLNRVPTASFQIPLQNKLSSYFLTPSWNGLLKVYRNNKLIFNGPVVSSAEAYDESTGQVVAVNASGPLWRLSYRLLGVTPAGWSLGNASTPYDLGYIAGQMLAAANAAGYTGIDLGTITASSNGAAGTYWFQDVLTSIANLSIGASSFDFEAAPTEPTEVGQAWPRIAVFNASPMIGSIKPNLIFEYGSGKSNVVSYSRQIDRSNFCTKAYIQQPAASDYSGTLTSEDTAAEADHGKFEALVDSGGVEWDVLRQKLADEAVLIRKNARQVVQFQPQPNTSPSPLDDYIVGDQIRARITVENVTILDAMMRVWGITFTVDTEGNETPTLELISPFT